MQNAASANEGPLVSREQAGNKIGAALRLYVGRGRELVGLGTRMMSRGAKLVAVGGRA